MLLLLKLHLSLNLLASVFFLFESDLEIQFCDFEVGVGPLAETFGEVLFHPVDECLFEDAAFFVELAGCVDPCVETFGYLHVGGTGNKVSHYFLTKRLHLVNCVLLNVLSDQDVILNFLNRIFMPFLPPFQLINISIIHIECLISHSLLPSGQRVKFSISIYSVLRPCHKLLS